MNMSPEEQKAYLERDRKKEADERLKESGDRWIKIMAELKDKLEEVKASSQSEEESDYDEGKTPPLEEEF